MDEPLVFPLSCQRHSWVAKFGRDNRCLSGGREAALRLCAGCGVREELRSQQEVFGLERRRPHSPATIEIAEAWMLGLDGCVLGEER